MLPTSDEFSNAVHHLRLCLHKHRGEFSIQNEGAVFGLVGGATKAGSAKGTRVNVDRGPGSAVPS
eukprot:NODE_5514_length_699_cov_9.875385_g4653_i0.p5 GENE.NODE_5514_length_699_cov_9.875385_g4653_i0~~NODE_5514_length_699_cov_9.875385_g4653_i0.p5  ORF type:complete len:65 (+),score=3.02 NODE_5514_length_699_cov_9.875385_g4653_i0:319-513(+)